MTMPSLDVLFSLITVYIVLALTVSAATEVLTRIVGLRSTGLKSGIRSILQDPATKSLAKETTAFWKSGIVKSATDGDSSPNSLDGLTFATATLASTGLKLPQDLAKVKEVVAASDLNDHLKQVLIGLSDRALHRGTTLHDELAQHFDATMEKVGRWYRHWTQGIAFVLAIIFTIFMNVNSLDLLHQLTANPQARLELVKIQSTLSAEATKSFAGGEAQFSGKPPPTSQEQLSDVYELIARDTLGPKAVSPHGNREWLRYLCGIFITILAVSLGAPFWFDVLGRINPKPNGMDRPPSSVSVQPVAAVPPPAQDGNN